MSKVLSIALPTVAAIGGMLIGGPLGASAGIGATAGGALGGAAGGALGSSITGGNPLLGAAGGAIGGLASGIGAGAGGLAGSAGPMGVVASSSDPIAALDSAMTLTGTSTATDAAAALGYSSTNAMLAAANPSWLTAGAAAGGAAQNIPNSIFGTTAQPLTNGAAVQSAPGMFGGGATSGIGGAAGVAQKAAGIGPMGQALSVGSGLYGLYNSYEMQQLAKQANPMAGYSQQYAQELSQLTSNPSSITSMPDYQSGLDAVQRSMAAQGYQGSGNMAQALAQYGSSFYDQQVQQLAGLAGMGTTGATAQMQGQLGAAQLASSSLGSLGYASRMGGF